MQTVIKGKRYDTKTATEICKLVRDQPGNSHGFHETTLYRSPKGVFFIYVDDLFASLCGKDPMIEVVDRFKAWAIAEAAGLSQKEMQAAGFVSEEG